MFVESRPPSGPHEMDRRCDQVLAAPSPAPPNEMYATTARVRTHKSPVRACNRLSVIDYSPFGRTGAQVRRRYPLRVAGPTIGRIRLGQRLRAHREAAGCSLEDARLAVGARNDSTIRHWETGRRAPGKPVVIVLGQLYGLDGDALAELDALRVEASRREPWQMFGLPENVATYLGLEFDATLLRVVQHVIVPGLLQIEPYMRRLFALSGLDPATVDRRVGARLRRQERLAGDDPLQLTAVISEAVLPRCAHEPGGVGIAQLDHLVSQAQQPNIDIHVIPFRAGLHAGMDGAFSLLRFPEGLLGDVAYEESVSGGHLNDEALAVSWLDTLFNELRSRALGPNESLALIAQLADTSR